MPSIIFGFDKDFWIYFEIRPLVPIIVSRESREMNSLSRGVSLWKFIFVCCFIVVFNVGVLPLAGPF